MLITLEEENQGCNFQNQTACEFQIHSNIIFLENSWPFYISLTLNFRTVLELFWKCLTPFWKSMTVVLFDLFMKIIALFWKHMPLFENLIFLLKCEMLWNVSVNSCPLHTYIGVCIHISLIFGSIELFKTYIWLHK